MITGIIIFLNSHTSVIYENNLFYYFNISPILLVVLAVGIYILILIIKLIFSSENKEEITMLTINLDDTCFTLKAFYDSGFKAKDILNGREVLLLDYTEIKEKLPINLILDIDNYFEDRKKDFTYKIVPIFFSTISGEGSFPAVKPKSITAEKGDKIKYVNDALIGFSNKKLSENFSAIYGKNFKERLYIN